MFEITGRLFLVFLITYIFVLALAIFYKIYSEFRAATSVRNFDVSVFALGFAAVVFLVSILIGAIIYIRNR